MTGEVATLFETVVEGDYCIGCGACAALPGSPIRMEMDDSGRYRPRLDGRTGDAPVLAVCPFTNEGEHEDEIGSRLFAADCEPHDRIGFHMRTYAGHVAEDGYRAAGSSGGVGTWVLVELMRRGLVDAVLHVRPRSPDADGRCSRSRSPAGRTRSAIGRSRATTRSRCRRRSRGCGVSRAATRWSACPATSRRSGASPRPIRSSASGSGSRSRSSAGT